MADELVGTGSYIQGRGKDFCRGCSATSLFSAVDLGDLPIANELLHEVSHGIDKFPLHLRICKECGLGQVADVVAPERIFRDYRYLSSMSTTFLNHALTFVNKMVDEVTFTPRDWVLEIACNDGYLLKNFLTNGIKVVGIEPAENVAQICRNLGVETISEFFTSDLATSLLLERGFPKLIIANNVLAHVPDLIDFTKGLGILCGPETQISVENPSLENILISMQFDTIYHEHYSYLSATSVQNISKNCGLVLTKVERLPIHGGSNRYWLKKNLVGNIPDVSVTEMIKAEKRRGLFEEQNWIEYANKVNMLLQDFHLWLKNTTAENGVIYGYGAAAKASTILNYINVEPGLLLGIADVSLEKQSRFMPPNGIEIISPDALFLKSPTDIVIFPWNIKSEIASYLNQNLGQNVRLWSLIPELLEVTPNEITS